MTIHIDPEFQKLIPPLTSDEYAQLEANIIAEGVRDPLVLWMRGEHDFVVVDGHNRKEIAEKHGLQYQTITKQFDSRESVMDWMDKNQLGRRNLTEAQTRLIRGRTYERRKKAHGGDRKSSSQNGNMNERRTAQEVGDEFGVSKNTILRDAAFSRECNADPELNDLVMSGGNVKEYKVEKRKEERKQRIETESRKPTPNLPVKRLYPVLYADPPWRYEHCKTDNRKIENQYNTMSLREICDLPISDIAAKDAILFLWATPPKLTEAVAVMSAWGFEYRTCAVWDKCKIGMGYYFRQQHELLLVGVRGEIPAPPPEARVSSVISVVRGKHSEKPVCVYEIIEAMYEGFGKIELFARASRPGWDVWGNEV